MSEEVSHLIDNLRLKHSLRVEQYSRDLVQRFTPHIAQLKADTAKQEEIADEFERSTHVSQQLNSAYAEQVERNRNQDRVYPC